MKTSTREAVLTLAAKLANNHAAFPSFGWHDRPDSSELWAIHYTHNRDSGALERSNARAIAEALRGFGEDTCRAEHHGHWACGWIDGYAVKVWTDATRSEVTPAFEALAALILALEDYPCLDEGDFSREEYAEAQALWADFSGRLEYIRRNRSEFDFRSLADMLACARGRYFCGDAGHFLA